MRASSVAVVFFVALALLVASVSATPYCWISNHDDNIYVENVCIYPDEDHSFVCLSRADAPQQRVFVTDVGKYAFPCPVPQLDDATLTPCSAPFFPAVGPLTCTRDTLCVVEKTEYGDNAITSFSLSPPVVRNAPPHAVCARRSDVVGERATVVNGDITGFKTGYEWNTSIHGGPHGPDSISVTFYTDTACTKPLGGSLGTLGCTYSRASPSNYEVCNGDF